MTTHIPIEYTVLKPFSKYKEGDIVKLPSNVNRFSWLEESFPPHKFTQISRTIGSLIDTGHISKRVIIPITVYEEIKDIYSTHSIVKRINQYLTWTHDKGYTQLYLVTIVNKGGQNEQK